MHTVADGHREEVGGIVLVLDDDRDADAAEIVSLLWGLVLVATDLAEREQMPRGCSGNELEHAVGVILWPFGIES